jgi:hypothetical protein
MRLTNTSIWLTQGGKHEMVNFVLSSIPTFYMCAIKVPIEILNQVDRYRRHCLWKGGDTSSKKPSLATWSMVTKPKNRGGLGVINLRMQNLNLPWVKLIWSQYYSNGKVPGAIRRGGFRWRSIVKLLYKYKGIIQAELGSEESILFWTDTWNGRVLEMTYLSCSPSQ